MSGMRRTPFSFFRLGAGLALALLTPALFAQGTAPQPPVAGGVGGLGTPGGLATPIQIILVFTLLSLGPAILLSVTCFTRVLIVLHFLRQAIGTQTMPSNQILIGLSLFLSMFIMGPTATRVWNEALSPALDSKMSYSEALDKASGPLKEFMVRYTREKDIALFVNVAKLPRPKNLNDIPLRVMVPAFMISELKTAFQIGFVLYLPFLVIDLVVASILLSTGMMMLPPVTISTPFKILLFVLVDGWNLVIGSLVKSFF